MDEITIVAPLTIPAELLSFSTAGWFDRSIQEPVKETHHRMENVLQASDFEKSPQAIFGEYNKVAAGCDSLDVLTFQRIAPPSRDIDVYAAHLSLKLDKHIALLFANHKGMCIFEWGTPNGLENRLLQHWN